VLSLATMLSGCGNRNGVSAGSVAADTRSELRREQDCSNPQWKAANPGLYYNLCPHSPFR
jgi:hypothetical protein